MASFAVFEYDPPLERPIVFYGLPGIGDVGRASAVIISRVLGADVFARVLSDGLPALASVDGDSVLEPACHELKAGGGAVVVTGAFQGMDGGSQFELAKTVFDVLKGSDPSIVVILGGYEGDGSIPVAGAVSDPSLKGRAEAAGIRFVPGMPRGGVRGGAGAMASICKACGIPAICVLGSVEGQETDPKAASAVAEAALRLAGIPFDPSGIADLMQGPEGPVQNDPAGCPDEDSDGFSYIG